jgi:hypothetical protein
MCFKTWNSAEDKQKNKINRAPIQVIDENRLIQATWCFIIKDTTTYVIFEDDLPSFSIEQALKLANAGLKSQNRFVSKFFSKFISTEELLQYNFNKKIKKIKTSSETTPKMQETVNFLLYPKFIWKCCERIFHILYNKNIEIEEWSRYISNKRCLKIKNTGSFGKTPNQNKLDFKKDHFLKQNNLLLKNGNKISINLPDKVESWKSKFF